MAYKQPSAGLPFKQLGSSPAKQVVSFSILANQGRKISERLGLNNPKKSKKKTRPITTNPKKGLSQYDPKRGDDPYTPTSNYKSKHDTKVPNYRDPSQLKTHFYPKRPSIKLGVSKKQFMKSKK